MQPKRENQPTFFDLAMQQRGSANRVLETITREVDFTAAEERVAATYSEGGRPACRVGVLLRVMILQRLYGLSDPPGRGTTEGPPELPEIRATRRARGRAG